MATRVFLTGCSGVVGAAVIERLGPRRIVGLVHRAPVEGLARAVRGDVSAPRLGLERSEFDRLAREVDAIVHSAALTGFHERPEDVARVNVAAVENVLELAAAARAPVCHVSTAYVARGGGPGPRDARTVGTAGYVESKVAGEEVVRRSGLPYAIVRPSVVMGDSSTGRIAQFQGLHALAGYAMRGMLPLIPLPAGARIDFVPQDVVADVVAELVDGRGVHGEHWVTAGGAALSAAEMVAICVAVAQSRGVQADAPRLVDRATAEQLYASVAPTLGRSARRRFESLLELTAAFGSDQPLPSSVHALLGHAPHPSEVFERNCRHWAEVHGLGARASIGDRRIA